MKESLRLIALMLAFSTTACATQTGLTLKTGKAAQASPAAEEDSDQPLVQPEFVSGVARVSPSGDLLVPPNEEYRLGSGDKLDLEIIGEPDTRAQTFVTPDGKVYFDLIDGVEARDKTAAELKATLEEKLVRYYLNPQVSVTLIEAESRRINLLGRVNSPGSYPLKGRMRLLDAIALGGGLFTSRFTGTTEELADLGHSFVVRNGRMLPVDFAGLIREGDLGQNIYLRDGDFIYLPSALTNEVYVLGAVTEPRPVGFMGEMTLTAALGHGLGLLRTAKLERVSIVRGALTDPSVAVVDAAAILKGQAPNVRLAPGDIIYVPGEGTHSPKQLAREAVDTFVRVVAANEGSGLGSGGGAGPVNVNVPIGVPSP